MKKLKKDLSKLLRENCSELVYSSKHGDILIPNSALDLNLALLHRYIDNSIVLEDGHNIMYFLKQHLDVKTLIDFHFDVGMGSSTNPLYLIDIEPDRKYLVYYFGVLGEYWLIGALTKHTKKLLESFFEFSLLRKESGNSLPFQIMHGAPTSYDNYSSEIQNDFLDNVFKELEEKN